MHYLDTPTVTLTVLAFSATILTFPVPAHAQTNASPGFTSKAVQTSPITGDDTKQVVLMAVSIQPGAAVPPHTHPGDCVGALVEGNVELLVLGKEPRRLVAGDTYANPQGTVHWFRNTGESPAKLLNTLVVLKGVPPVQPASTPKP